MFLENDFDTELIDSDFRIGLPTDELRAVLIDSGLWIVHAKYPPPRKLGGAIVSLFLWTAGVQTNDAKVSFAIIKNVCSAELYPSVHKTAAFISAAGALSFTGEKKRIVIKTADTALSLTVS